MPRDSAAANRASGRSPAQQPRPIEARRDNIITPSQSLTLQPPPIATSLPPKKRAVSAACQECRKRKVKCTAERPSCTICLSRQTECVYDTAELETPRQALKRKYNDLQYTKTVYEKVFRELQSRPEPEAEAILQHIRRGIDADTLLRYIEHGDMLRQLSMVPGTRTRYELPLTNMPEYLQRPENPYLESLIYEWTLKGSPPADNGQASSSRSVAVREFYGPYLKPYHVAEIVDAQLDTVEPSKWTSVTSNDELMRGLLRAYFRHEYEWSPFFQKDLFLRDMSTGNRRFCSSLLVNAVLALTCHCYNDLSNRAEFWNPHTLGYQFFAETKRLWDLESETARLTTIQAGPIIHTLHNIHGADKLGWPYTVKSIRLAQELGLFKKSPEVQAERLSGARDFTAWTLYRWQSLLAYHNFSRPLLESPPENHLPDPSEEPQWYGELWLKYSPTTTLYPINFGEQFHATTNFRLIINDISREFFGGEGSPRIRRLDLILKTYTRLQSWYQGLVEPLKARNIVFPCHLKLHMHFHYVTIQLFQPLVQPGVDQAEAHDICERLFDKPPERVVSDARIHLETLLRIYYLRHGFEGLDIFLVAPLTLIGFMSLDAMNEPAVREDEQTRNELLSTTILCAKGLSDQAQSQFSAGVVFRLLRDRMAPEDVDALRTFVKVAEIEEAMEPRLHYVQSTLPVNVVSITDDPESQRLGNLLKEYVDPFPDSEDDLSAAE